MSDVIDLSQHKLKQESLFKIQNAISDVEAYKKVIYKSLREWDSYGIFQKAELYESVSLFNLEILNELVERMKDEH